jgi:excisionase family DNA binding protein
MEERYLSLAEACEVLGKSERTLYRWIKSGKLKAYKPGRDYEIPESAIRQMRERSEVYPKVQAPLWSEEPERRDAGTRRAAELRDVRETFGPVAKGLEAYCERWEEKLSVAQAEAGPTPRDVEEFVAVARGFRDVIWLAQEGELRSLDHALGLAEGVEAKVLSGVPKEAAGEEVSAQFAEHSLVLGAWQRWIAVGRALAESVGGEEAQRVRRALTGVAA